MVTVWERFVAEFEATGEILVELGSDQTSCHNPFNGGYYPVQLNFEEAQDVSKNEKGFRYVVPFPPFSYSHKGLQPCASVHT